MSKGRQGNQSSASWLLNNALFIALFLGAIGLLALLGNRYYWQFDWTLNQRNTLAEASLQLLDRMHGPIHVRAFARESEAVRRGIEELVDRYRRRKSDITLEFSNPDRIPAEIRALNITVAGELIVSYRTRAHHVTVLSEGTLTNALRRLLRADQRWLAYLTGHGERDWSGDARRDYGLWTQLLGQTGLEVRALTLAPGDPIPDNTTVLALTQGRVALAPVEIEQITEFVERGGNLLWFADPAEDRDLDWLASQLGITFVPGALVDPGSENPRFVEVSTYPSHAVTRNITAPTLYPNTAGLVWESPPGWSTSGILGAGLAIWAETDPRASHPNFDPSLDVAGPHDIAVALQRRVGERSQRVVVIGDGDFVSNAYLGAGSNLDLGMNVVNWLLGDDELIDIPTRFAIDLHFAPSQAARLVIGLGAPFGTPVLLLAVGGWIWHRRRKR